MHKLVVLAGNPNVGKSTLFNQLTGSHQKIANYPGVTVEKHEGHFTTDTGQHITILDLPGTYSLNTKSEDETIATNSILGSGANKPDVVIVVAEATKLQRALLLALQVKRYHSQVILAINMMDELLQFKMHLDIQKLSTSLNVPVVPITAREGKGICELISAIEAFPKLNSQDTTTRSFTPETPNSISDDYKSINTIIRDVLTHDSDLKNSDSTDQIDKYLLHPVLGPVLFVALMLVLFQSLFTWSAPLMDAIESLFGLLSEMAQTHITNPILKSAITDGLINGVGSVVVFVPQIAITFVFIGLLEMSGYLARGAFLIDRFMRLFGLEGRAFIPLISSFSCAIPGILGTRTLTDSRQRLITILIAPLMTCSARLPVYTLLITCFVPDKTLFGLFNMQGLTLFGLFLAGVLAAMTMAWVFNRILPKSHEAGSFLMELPRYRRPDFRALYKYVTLRTSAFLRSAGTIIFVLSLVLWALAYFPRSQTITDRFESERRAIISQNLPDKQNEDALALVDQAEQGEFLRDSYMGRVGQLIEPALAPMGFDWKLGIGVLSSFAAREVFVSTMGIVFNLGETDEESETLREKLQSQRNPDGSQSYTFATALSLLVFFAFAAQCISTLAAIKRETNSSKWAWIAFGYLTVLAYVSSTIVYQVTSRLI